MKPIETMEELTALYGEPSSAALKKEADFITEDYATFIRAARFMALSTVGPEGTDCSPRGDKGPVAYIHDAKTLLIPDRRGNNRIDSLRNILRDPRVSLMFMIPGSSTIIRVNGKAHLTAEPQVLDRLAEAGKPPRSVIVVKTDAVYFQCSRALMRSELWRDAKETADLPTAGQILANMTDGAVGGADYDREWPKRAQESMW